jgi:hypothetical protein
MVMSIISKDDHVTIITRHLSGKAVNETLLWEAVGYFLYGKGKDLPKPCTEEEWQRLLEETGHDKEGT